MSRFDSLLTSALDALEPAVSQALDAVEGGLSEYPAEGGANAALAAARAGESAEDEAAAAEDLEAAAAAEAAAEAWSGVSLSALRESWDAEAEALAERRERAAAARARLAGSRPDDAAALRDALEESAARAKAAEELYLHAYRALYDAPDPAEVLAAAAAATRRREETARRARAQAGAASEVVVLRQQLARTRKEAEDERMSQDAQVARLLEVGKREAEEAAVGLRQREEAALVQLESAQAQLRTLRRAHEGRESALFELRSSMEETGAARQAALETVASDMERAEQRVKELELALRRERERAAESSSAELGASDEGLEERLAAAERAVFAARASAVESERALSAERARAAEALAAARADTDEARKDVDALRRELLGRPTARAVAEATETIRQLKGLLDVDVGAAFEASPDDTSGGAKAMETALREKARKLQSEALALRRQLEDAGRDAEAVRAECNDFKAQLDNQASLAAKLEEDLASAVGSNGGADAAEAAEPKQALLQVVVGQRERFRDKAEKAEAEVDRLTQLHKAEQDRTAKARKDNVALYEKVRYLESAGTRGARMDRLGGGGGAPPRRGPLAQCLPQRPDLETGAAPQPDTPEARAAFEYQASLDPFKSFQRNEQLGAQRRLRLHDRIAFSSGRLLSTNAVARAFFLAYLLCLHLFLSFVVLRGMAINSAYYSTAYAAELPSQQAVATQLSEAAAAAKTGAGESSWLG